MVVNFSPLITINPDDPEALGMPWYFWYLLGGLNLAHDWPTLVRERGPLTIVGGDN